MFDKEEEISQIIEKGVDAILSGTATVEDVLRQHPEYAEELRLELDTALWLISRSEKMAPRSGFVAASRKRVVERVKKESIRQQSRPSLFSSFFGFFWPRRFAFNSAALLVILIMLASGTGVVSASQSAVPGEGLYPIKRMYEQVSLDITTDEFRRASLSAEFSKHRLSEVEVLVTRGEFTAVEETLQEYERAVDQTIVFLEQVSQSSEKDNESLADLITDNFTNNVKRLEALAQLVPAGAKDDIAHAQDTSGRGMTAASRLMGPDKKTPVPSATPTLAPTPTGELPVLKPTQAGPKEQPAKPTTGQQEEPQEINPTKDLSGSPAKVTPTARPTNANKPAKPDSQPNSGDSAKPDNAQPPEEKPPKEDKPEKEDKSGNNN